MTIPHKQAVIPLCDELDEIARAAGSVNTLVFDDGRILGSSTDGDAVAVQVDADDRRVARARCRRELAGGRRGARARRRRRDDGESPRAGLAARRPSGYDILVNATPVKDELIVAPHGGMEVVDLAYLPDGTRHRARRGRPRGRLRCDRRRPRRAPLPGRRRVRALDGPRGAARRDARGAARLLIGRSILRHDNERKGERTMNQYETIGIVLGVAIFGLILLSTILVSRREHA